MYCSHCGQQVQDSAAFCSHCGKALIPATPSTEARQEFCEIGWVCERKGFITDTLKFWASATGPKGNYSAGESATFSGSSRLGPIPVRKQDCAALNEFVSALSRDGWDRVESSGRAWYSYTFRRLVNAPKAD